MNHQEAQSQACFDWRVLALLSILIFLAYSNTFHASWHLDDFHNITENPRIQINNLYPDTLYNIMFASTDSNRVFYRPVSNFSLALNWYFGQNNVIGYHITNTLIHCLTAFFLYLAVLALFKTPNLSGRFNGNEYFIAFLAAVLWAANPIQTQAITYIVQRMASMAAMFYIIGVYLFIKARVGLSWKSRGVLYAGVFAAFLLAVGSKENALMFPVSIFWLEMLFFRDLSDPETRKRFVWIGCVLAAALFVAGVVLFMSDGFITRLQDGYANRTFTLTERLLTQPRIIAFYLSQIFYPIADRLSITHDIEVSTGLFRPWTTLPAILLILGLIGAAFWKIRQYPLISFAILFFFVNHVIESSIIPLELIFEHRNYLPSLFLFMPVAAGLKWVIDYYQKEKRSMAAAITAFATILVMVLGIGTYVRNMVWANEKSLWEDALEKAPETARPYHNLASGYYAKVGDWDKVEDLCKQAITLYDSRQDKAKVISLINIAAAHDRRDKDYKEVIRINKKVLNIVPERSKSRYHIVLALIKNGQLDSAMEHNKKLLKSHPEKMEYLNTKAFIHLKKNEPKKALTDLTKAVGKNSDDENVNLSLGLTKSMLGKYKPAEHYLSRVVDSPSRGTVALLLLIENSVRAKDLQRAENYAKELLSTASPETIRENLKEADEPGMMWPISAELAAPVVSEVLNQQSINFMHIYASDADEN